MQNLNKMPALAVLKMWLPKELEIDIGNDTDKADWMEVGDRGAQFIA